MRWLMLGLFISLGWLLIAVLGLVWHVWQQRRRQRRELPDQIDASQETDLEIEP